jgi:hypothetical protein
MGLVSRKKARQEQGQEMSEVEAEGEPTVEVSMAGPDAERLEGMIDMSEIAAVLRRAAKGDKPPEDGGRV